MQKAMEVPEMFVDGLRFEGMMLCPGCGDVFVLKGLCAECARLNVLMENKRRADAQYLSPVERVEMGLVECKQPDLGMAPFKRSELLGLAVVDFVGVLGCVLFVVGGFYFLRGGIGMLLAWSR
jgi:hypothetical protein